MFLQGAKKCENVPHDSAGYYFLIVIEKFSQQIDYLANVIERKPEPSKYRKCVPKMK